VIALSIVAFAVVGKQSAIVMVGSRIVLIPVIASVGYEILRAGARYRRNRLVHAILLPGLWVQMITTKRPTDDMIRVAIVSMEEALVADGEAVPAGSEPIRREPMVLGTPAAAAPQVATAAIPGATMADEVQAGPTVGGSEDTIEAPPLS